MIIETVVLLIGPAFLFLGLGIVVWTLLPETDVPVWRGVAYQVLGWYFLIFGIGIINLAINLAGAGQW